MQGHSWDSVVNVHLRQFVVWSHLVLHGETSRREMMAVSFQGAHFPKDILLRGVRWCVAYPLSTRQVEALMQERGVSVDDATINWWVVT
jgi:hypothetical protein